MIRAESGPATNWPLVIAAFSVLVVGSLVYLLDRPADSVPFFSAISLHGLSPGLFGRIGEHLPTFCHVFAFSLLTASWWGGGQRVALTACLFWFGIDTAFEAGQHAEVADHLVRLLPGWFKHLPILRHADAYFLSGTFDVWDLISIAAGAAAAFLLATLKLPRYIQHG